ncbi:hypothetical protein PanWU01x14_369980 [Parasponia andersonii]|uniref:Uncharacterized protein n=1 Tax=Parasponia andersonii TaxID=3476 RepID=A0A2P5A4F4_PARAD|nr:hypothetical protein PanWU01x14_369980 [Parasponia andersonii]
MFTTLIEFEIYMPCRFNFNCPWLVNIVQYLRNQATHIRYHFSWTCHFFCFSTLES